MEAVAKILFADVVAPALVHELEIDAIAMAGDAVARDVVSLVLQAWMPLPDVASVRGLARSCFPHATPGHSGEVDAEERVVDAVVLDHAADRLATRMAA